MKESSDAVTRFRQYLTYQGKSPRTIKYYTYHIQKFLDFIRKPPEKITKEDVMDYYEYLQSSKNYTNRSLNIVGWSLKSFLEMLGLNELAMWIPTPRYEVTYEPKWLPEDVIKKIIDSEAVLVVAYDLALRLSEVSELRRDLYNKRTGDIEVTRMKKKGRANKQILTLSPQAREILNEYIAKTPSPDGRMFPISRRMIQYIFKRNVKVAGLNPKEYTFHVLRHSRATNIAIKQLQENGYVDIVSLAKFLGHSRPETTMIYVHLANKYLKFHT